MKTSKLVLFFLVSGLLFLFTCKKVVKEMAVTTGSVTEITITTAKATGQVLDLGEGATTCGHCYATTPKPTVSGTKTELDNPVVGKYISNLTGLSAATKYYVRAYLSRGSEVVYGIDSSFTTLSDAPPVLTTVTVTDITKTTAVSGGIITSQGGTPVTARGVCWSLATAPNVSLTTKTSDGSGTGSFSSSMTGLTAGTKYYVRAYATNSGNTAYGNELNFTTSPDVVTPPVVTTAAVSSITTTSAVCGGDVTNEGGSSVTAKGVCWSTSANPTIINSTTINGTGPGSFVSNITGLDPGTKYYVRAYATNSAWTAYGAEYNFTTSAVIPTLTTIAINSITSTSAASGGNITSDGGATVTARGVCWSTTSGPTTANSKTSDATGTGSYTSSIAGLSSNTKYYVRAYATNSVGTAYGNEVSFTTQAILATSGISNITATTATGGGNITAGGGESITAKGICWSTSTNPTTANSTTSDGTGTGTFTSSITGLTSNTIYYVRAYATNAGGTSYGDQQTFTSLASLTTTAISAITSTTASSGGDISVGGAASITSRGVCWSTTANPTTANSKTSDASGTGSFTSSITGLTSNTVYYVRAYATNAGGTAYGSQQTFTCLAVLTTTAVTNITAITASSGGTITVGGGASITARGVCWSTSSNPTTSNSKTSDGTGTGGFTSAITGLTRLTTYYVRAYATNAGGTAYGNQVSFTSALCPASLTMSHVAGTTAPVTKTVTYGIIESNLSGSNKCWITRNLGASSQAASAIDATEAAAGWYWQFNRTQGFKHDGTTRTPGTSWITSINENSNWLSVNDPCRLLIGTFWRIPTMTEWLNANTAGGWAGYTQTYSSVLKIHAAGSLFFSDGTLSSRGSLGLYWSSTQYSDVSYGSMFNFTSFSSGQGNNPKSRATTIRCIQD